MKMKEITSKKIRTSPTSFGSCRALLLLVGALMVLVTTQHQLALAQKYSDWSTPINLGAAINSSLSDQQPAISKNGLSLYFASTRSGGLGGFDIYVSQRASADDPWGSPINLGATVNTTLDDGNPAFSRDGHLMFFQSRRPGGFGAIDIWASQREQTHDDFGWQPAVNLGAGVNSAADDNGPSYFENEEDGAPQLYFASSRAGGLGAADIYLSEQLADGSFGAATLIPELSSSSLDSDPSIRHDGLEIVFQSNRLGSVGLSNDIWVSTRESTLSPWSIPVNLVINTVSAEQNSYLSSDGKTLFFASDRPGGFGGSDLYVSTRTKLRGQP